METQKTKMPTEMTREEAVSILTERGIQKRIRKHIISLCVLFGLLVLLGLLSEWVKWLKFGPAAIGLLYVIFMLSWIYKSKREAEKELNK